MLPVAAPEDPSGRISLECSDPEDCILQIQRRADDVAIAVLTRVVRVEPQRVVIADGGGPALPVPPIHLAGGDRDHGPILAADSGSTRLSTLTVNPFVLSSSHFAAMSAPPPSVDSTRAARRTGAAGVDDVTHPAGS